LLGVATEIDPDGFLFTSKLTWVKVERASYQPIVTRTSCAEVQVAVVWPPAVHWWVKEEVGFTAG
jgi:hypothetical protein